MPELLQHAKGHWRPMRSADLAGVVDIAAIVHPSYPEDVAVFAERLQLYPDGCLVFEGGGGLLAYVISHPWVALSPPSLNVRLGSLPAAPATYYIHDIALLPALRGSGAAARVVGRLFELADEQSLPTMSLVAVNGSRGFWHRHGFREFTDVALADKLRSYDDDAVFMVREM